MARGESTPEAGRADEETTAEGAAENRSFKDHFSHAAAGGHYARFRPRYPAGLFGWLAAVAPGHGAAWDCATGSGQAAVGLAEHFDRVFATDASPDQVAHAEPDPRVEYRVAPADASGLAAGAVDVVTVAQALHWFALDGFYAEARRVLRPRGVLAAWCYATLSCGDPAVDGVLETFYGETVGPYWPPERRLVESGYASLPFPFDEMEAPAFHIEAELTVEGLAGYLRTWSASQRFARERREDPVALVEPELRAVWGPDACRRFRWPLLMRVGRVPARG